jgi:hypothetical protein
VKGPASVATAALLAAACTGLFVGPDTAFDRSALFEHVWRDVDRQYALFGLKAVSWDSLHDVYAPRAALAASDDELAEVVGAMLRELRDTHVGLHVGLRAYVYTGYDSRPAFFDSAVVHGRYVADFHPAPNDRLRFGHAGPDVGYVWIPNFRGSGFGADLDDALAQLRDVRALVVDVREGRGGNLESSIEIARRFADRARVYGYMQFRDGPEHDDLTPPEPRQVSPAATPRFAGPVAVLTSRRSVSATEWFVLAMRVLPNVTVVGDSTAGGSGAVLPRELPNGWTYTFSASLGQAVGSGPFEEVGLAPDIWVRGSAQELAAGRDAALDTALAVVRRALP